MTDRDAARNAFLKDAGWATAKFVWRPGDASFRRYARLTAADGATAMLMDAPPPRESAATFLDVGQRVAAAGVSVPNALAADRAAGFILMEDFGDDTFARLLAGGASAAPLWAGRAAGRRRSSPRPAPVAAARSALPVWGLSRRPEFQRPAASRGRWAGVTAASASQCPLPRWAQAQAAQASAATASAGRPGHCR